MNALSNLNLLENAGLQTVNLAGISVGAANEVQSLTITATSSDPGIIPNPTVNYTSPNTTGSLTFQPVANANGTVTVTVTVNDGQVANNTLTRTFTVNVSAVNSPPTLAALSNVTLNEDTGVQTVSLAGISTGATNENQMLTVTATSSIPGLIPTPTVSYTSPNATGSLSFTPSANSNGTAIITVTVNDGIRQQYGQPDLHGYGECQNDAPTLNALTTRTLPRTPGPDSESCRDQFGLPNEW